MRAIEGASEMLVEDSEIYTPDWQAVEVDGHCRIRDSSLEGAVTGNATTRNVDNNVEPPVRGPEVGQRGRPGP